MIIQLYRVKKLLRCFLTTKCLKYYSLVKSETKLGIKKNINILKLHLALFYQKKSQ